MKLRLFLPPVDRPEAETRFAWMLFDARNGVLRQGETTLAEIPRAAEVEAILPASRVLFARLKLPRVNAATIRELLPYAVEDRLLADPAHVHAVAGNTDAHGETTVTVVDRDWLRAMLDAASRAGLRPGKAYAEGSLLAGGRGDWNVVWGPERGMLVDDEGATVAFDRGPADELPLAIRIALDEASARGDRPAQARVHTDQDAPLPDLARWSSDGGIPFSRGTRWEELCTAQCGPDANLLQGEFAPREPMLPGFRIPRAAIVLAAALVLLQFLFVAVDAWRLERERNSLEARREAIFRSAFPEAKVVVDPALQMSRNLASLRRERGLAAEDDFLAGVTQAARTSPGAIRSVEYEHGRLRVQPAAR